MNSPKTVIFDSSITAPENPTWKRIINEIRGGDCSFGGVLEILFRIEQRGSSISTEIRTGFIHFLSASAILGVNPSQLAIAGYDRDSVASATSLCSGLSCIMTGIICNFPFISAPILPTAIYLSAYIKNHNLDVIQGNTAVFFFGILLASCTIRQVTDFIAFIIPFTIKKGVVIGVALLIAFQALLALKIVIPGGTTTILQLGTVWTTSNLIAMLATVLITVLVHYDVKGAYVIGLSFGSLMYWLVTFDWPSEIFMVMGVTTQLNLYTILNSSVLISALDLFTIATILLSGLSNVLAELGGIKRADGTVARRRWLYFVCGMGTLLSSGLGAGPVLISAESAVGIISGARTGLSACVCGLLFLCSYFFFPLFADIPVCATSPVLLMVGLVLFNNTADVKWRKASESLPAFVTVIISIFSYSILWGVVFGVCTYCVIGFVTSDILARSLCFPVMQISSQCFGWDPVMNQYRSTPNS